MHMLTEALRALVMRVAWEHDAKVHSSTAGLTTHYSCDVIEEVTELYMAVREAQAGRMDHHTDKLVRDAFIWRHLAGDSVLRLRVISKMN